MTGPEGTVVTEVLERGEGSLPQLRMSSELSATRDGSEGDSPGWEFVDHGSSTVRLGKALGSHGVGEGSGPGLLGP